jgi:hypothetical protein
VLKITIGGEVFSYDETSQPLDEAIAIEEGLGMSYGAFEAALQNGSAKAMAGLIWAVLKRNGRDVPLADILTGKYQVNASTVAVEQEGGENPTAGTPSSPGTAGPTSGSSPRSSATPRRKSGSSPSPSSTT